MLDFREARSEDVGGQTTAPLVSQLQQATKLSLVDQVCGMERGCVSKRERERKTHGCVACDGFERERARSGCYYHTYRLYRKLLDCLASFTRFVTGLFFSPSSFAL